MLAMTAEIINVKKPPKAAWPSLVSVVGNGAQSCATQNFEAPGRSDVVTATVMSKPSRSPRKTGPRDDSFTGHL